MEDGGAGICFHVFVYNCQPGIGIDYATGDSWVLEKDVPLQIDVDEGFLEEADIQTFILNLNTKKFHLSVCDSVNDMKEKNKKEVTCSREKVIEDGYEPCQRCNP